MFLWWEERGRAKKEDEKRKQRKIQNEGRRKGIMGESREGEGSDPQIRRKQS